MPAQSAQLHLGVIGLGRMGQLYARTLATQGGGVKLYAVAEPDERSRSAIAGEFAVPHTCADADELLALDAVDAVVIATPTSTHAALVVAAAGAGKAILCEKPLALTLAQTHTALEALARAGVPFQIGFMRRFDAAYARAQSLIAAGRIGRPVTFKSVGRDPFCPQAAYADPSKSGGLIVDMAIHDFDLARWLMGNEVERVTAEGTLLVCPELEAIGDFDNAVVNLRFASGALGNIEVSRNAFYGYDIRTEVLGSDGALLIGAHHNTPLLLLTREGAQHDLPPYLLERFGDAYRAQLQYFVECLRRGQVPSVGGADALAAMEIAVAATRAAQTGQAVSLDAVRALAV